MLKPQTFYNLTSTLSFTIHTNNVETTLWQMTLSAGWVILFRCVNSVYTKFMFVLKGFCQIIVYIILDKSTAIYFVTYYRHHIYLISCMCFIAFLIHLTQRGQLIFSHHYFVRRLSFIVVKNLLLWSYWTKVYQAWGKSSIFFDKCVILFMGCSTLAIFKLGLQHFNCMAKYNAQVIEAIVWIEITINTNA